MTISGILMALSGHIPAAGIFWASASCMFLTACHFSKAEEKADGEKPQKETEK